VGNFDFMNNGTAANPITNVGTHGIATGNSGSSEVEYLIANNRVTANNFEAGALGIRSASIRHIMADGTTLATPTLKTIIENNVIRNTIRNTTGGGIRVLQSKLERYGTGEGHRQRRRQRRCGQCSHPCREWPSRRTPS
jgi:hypothetical protein